jgi:uncharacterized membrane protein YadS
VGSHIFKVGVVLLDIRIVYGDLVLLGWKTATLLLAFESTIFDGCGAGKAVGPAKHLGVLTRGPVRTWGASEAIAIAAVLQNSRHNARDTPVTITVVISLSTIAMVLYPVFVDLLSLDVASTRVFLGSTIHEVPQFVVVGYLVSMQAGDLATLTKLVRVAFLMPVLLNIILVVRMELTLVSSSNS